MLIPELSLSTNPISCANLIFVVNRQARDVLGACAVIHPQCKPEGWYLELRMGWSPLWRGRLHETLVPTC